MCVGVHYTWVCVCVYIIRGCVCVGVHYTCVCTLYVGVCVCVYIIRVCVCVGVHYTCTQDIRGVYGRWLYQHYVSLQLTTSLGHSLLIRTYTLDHVNRGHVWSLTILEGW